MICSHRPEFLIHTDQVLKWFTPASARFRKVLHSLPVMTLKTILFLIYQKSKTLCWRLGRPVIIGSQVTDGLLPSPSQKRLFWSVGIYYPFWFLAVILRNYFSINHCFTSIKYFFYLFFSTNKFKQKQQKMQPLFLLTEIQAASNLCKCDQ